MPSVATILSGGVSIGIFAGVFSGICYLLIAGIRWAGKLRASLQAQEEARLTTQNEKACARCGRQLSLLAVGRSRRLQCARCKLNVCRHCCYRTDTNKWLCSSCRKHRDVKLQSGEWFYQQLRQRFRSTVAALSSADKNDEEVREFMEKLVETLVDGKLDNVPLNPLSSHQAYVNFFTLYHNILADTLTRLSFSLKMAVADKTLPEGEPPSVVHMELKELMTQIIQKAMELPSFKNDYGVTSNVTPTTDLDIKSYEDILATAILNKIISRYQQQLKKQKLIEQNSESFDRNSNILTKRHISSISASGTMDGHHSNEAESEGSSGSVANSYDEYNSWSESSHHDPLSLTIEECIEEVTTRYNSDDEPEVPASEIDRFLSSLKFMKKQRVPFPEFGMDIIDGRGISSDSEAGGDDEEDDDEVNVSVGVEVVNPVDSWEENWLFQRRKLKTAVGTCQPVPVPMLVPHPSQEYRALIGDVDADETSDLSECSDSVLEDLIDGADLKSYSKSSEYEEDKEDQEVLDKQRELFLEYIREDLTRSSIEINNKLNGNNMQEARGISPDTGQEIANELLEKSRESFLYSNEVTKTNHDEIDEPTNHVPANIKDVAVNEKDSVIPDNHVNEARNLDIPILQVDSGEGSLEMQQDSEYTVHYATVAQLEPGSGRASPVPIPKPRTIPVDKTLVCKENKSHTEPENISEFERPPLPGSIAEREHLKWQKAPPLPNNPYSKENIERRQRNRMYLSRRSSSEASIEFPDLTPSNEPSLIEIDGKTPSKDYSPYVRDYYVNVKTEKEEEIEVEGKLPKAKQKPVPTTPSEPIIEEGRQQVSVRVEVEVARWPSGTITTVPKTKPSVQTQTVEQVCTTTWAEPAIAVDDDHIALPSVKELAQKFSMLDEMEKVPRPVSPLIEKNKQQDMKVHSPLRQVHSLTARSISREFRDGLRGGTTAASKLGVNDKDVDNSGQISDDSGTASPTPANALRHKIHDNIVFWEKKQINNR